MYQSTKAGTPISIGVEGVKPSSVCIALMSAQVVLAREKNRLVAEIIVHARQDHTLAGLGATNAWGTSLTAAVKKVLQQAETVKGKWQARKRSAASVRTVAPAVSVRAPRPRARRRA